MPEKSHCPICGKTVEEPIKQICSQMRQVIIEKIKRDHPEWLEKDGACPKCLQHYKRL